MSPLQGVEIRAMAESGLAEVLAVADKHRTANLGGAYLNRSVGDVLSHLHSWQVLFEGWIATEASGEEVHYPADGFTWRDLDRLNELMYEEHRASSYDQARADLVASHERMLAVLSTIPDAELADANMHQWLGHEPLGEVAHECLGAHYAWAMDIFAAAGLTDGE